MDTTADENEEEADITPDADSTAADVEPSASQESVGAAGMLLDDLASAVFADHGDLGEIARSLRDAVPRTSRQRDIFPLPLGSCRSEFAKAMVAVLNFLCGVRAPVHVARRVTVAQQSALDSIDACLCGFSARLRSCCPGSPDAAAWDVFEPDAAEPRLELVAARVDCPDRVGTCDPLPLLPAAVREQLLDVPGL